jgi:hypothetical protein
MGLAHIGPGRYRDPGRYPVRIYAGLNDLTFDTAKADLDYALCVVRPRVTIGGSTRASFLPWQQMMNSNRSVWYARR